MTVPGEDEQPRYDLEDPVELHDAGVADDVKANLGVGQDALVQLAVLGLGSVDAVAGPQLHPGIVEQRPGHVCRGRGVDGERQDG